MDLDGNGCVTEDEFNQIAAANQILPEDMPAFQDVALAADGIADCILIQDFIQYSPLPEIVRPEIVRPKYEVPTSKYELPTSPHPFKNTYLFPSRGLAHKVKP